MQRFILALDLKNDEALIAEYERYHEKIPLEIEKSIRDAGVLREDIYRVGNRLVMVLETTDAFSLQKKSKMDAENPHVQAWEKLMLQFQQALPQAKEGEKWLLMNQIFEL